MNVDVAIIGGGLAGASLAAALNGSRFSIALVEGRAPAPPRPEWDRRVYALSPANQRFLDAIGAWAHLDRARITPVYDMAVCGDRGGRLDFSAYDAGVDELAWIIESGLMQRELWETVKRQPNLTLLCPEQPRDLRFDAEAAWLTLESGRRIAAKLVVGADGVDSWVRESCGIRADVRPYGEMGVVANFACERPHRNTAFQWFLKTGVLAYLPLAGDAVSVVWSLPDADAAKVMELPPDVFSERVAAAAGHRLGMLHLLTAPAAFPLRLMRVDRTIGARVALIGDAAHAIHPLSGHGINLGFQDARTLAEVLRAVPDFRDIGRERELRPFARARAEEVLALQSVTHALNLLFRPRNDALALLRNAGLNLTNRLPVVRSMMARYALG